MRKTEYDIDPLYIKRWSSRAFTHQEVPQDVLYSLFEAARWAPSSANVQPWRYVVARTKEDRDAFLTFINDGNSWCSKAPVLVAVISHKKWNETDDDLNPTHAFDTGTAWGFLALEATRKNLVAHAMGGFNRKKAKEVLQIPADYEVHAIIAIGYRGAKEELPEGLQKREKPSDRKKVSEFVSESVFER